MKITNYLSACEVHHLLPEYTWKDMVSVPVTIENEVIKKKKQDHRTVNAIFIKVSKTPGVQIFVLEPTKNDLRNSRFQLDETTHLTIHANGWVYTSTKITFPKRPSHPIVYATLSGYETPLNQPTISFDPMQIQRRTKLVLNGRTPDYAHRRATDTAIRLMDETDYMIGEISNGKRSRPVHMKHLNHSVLGILETYSYFHRSCFPLEKGCILFDGSKEYLIKEVQFLDYPRFPIIFVNHAA